MVIRRQEKKYYKKLLDNLPGDMFESLATIIMDVNQYSQANWICKDNKIILIFNLQNSKMIYDFPLDNVIRLQININHFNEVWKTIKKLIFIDTLY